MTNQNKFEKHDHESDPAHTPEHGWGDEGGASPVGPATHVHDEPVHHSESEPSTQAE